MHERLENAYKLGFEGLAELVSTVDRVSSEVPPRAHGKSEELRLGPRVTCVVHEDVALVVGRLKHAEDGLVGHELHPFARFER
jgi:hypothetical protein